MAALSNYPENKDESSASRLLSSDDGLEDSEPLRGSNRDFWSTTRWRIALIFCIVSTNLLSISVTSLLVYRSHNSCSSVSEPPIGVAPLLRSLPSDAKPTKVNTPFYNRENSIYREHESPSTEAAWLELTQIRMLLYYKLHQNGYQQALTRKH